MGPHCGKRLPLGCGRSTSRTVEASIVASSLETHSASVKACIQLFSIEMRCTSATREIRIT